MKIRMENVCKTYHSKGEKVEALDNVSIELPETGFICICGRNGSGKSSFLNCLSLLDEDFEGKLYLDDVCINTLTKEEKREIRSNTFGYIFQKNNLIASLTGKENIFISNKVFKEESKEELQIDEDLPLRRCPNQLSGGQQQRIAIYRALAQNKPIIVCDEPTAALDYQNTKKVMQKLKDISKNRLVICITHDKDLVENNADRIIEFESGKIVKDTILSSSKHQMEPIEYKQRRISYGNLFKLGCQFFQKKWVLGICFCIIFLFLFLAIAMMASYTTFDSKLTLTEQLEKDKIYTPNRKVTMHHTNGDILERDIQISNEIIKNCTNYLGETNFGYSIPDMYDGVLFFKNSQIPIGEGSIGTQTLKKIFNKTTLTEPIRISLSHNLMSIEIKLTSTFEGEGVRCDYESSKLYKNTSIMVYGGLWKNKIVDTDSLSIERYLQTGIVYVPISNFNSNSGMEPIDLKEEEAIISEALLQYLDLEEGKKEYIKSFISFADFTNQEGLYSYVNMNEIYAQGMKIISALQDSSWIGRDMFVIVSDQKYKEIEENMVFFTGVSFYGKENQNEIINMFLDCNYSFSKDQASNTTIDQVLRLGQEIQQSKPVLISVVIGLSIILLLITYIFLCIVLKADSIKIGILRCLGLSSKQSLISSIVAIVLLQVISIFLSWIIGAFLVNSLNYSYATGIYQAGISIFRIDFKVIGIELCIFIGMIVISFLYLYFVNRNKQIKDYFLTE